MGLTITQDKPESATVTVNQRVLLTEDGRAVPATDPKGRWLLCPEGGQMTVEDAKKYGLMPEKKEAQPAETKEVKPQETKAAPSPAKKRTRRKAKA